MTRLYRSFFHRTLHHVSMIIRINCSSRQIRSLVISADEDVASRSVLIAALFFSFFLTPLFLRSSASSIFLASFTRHCVYRRPGCWWTRRWRPAVSRRQTLHHSLQPQPEPQHHPQVQQRGASVAYLAASYLVDNYNWASTAFPAWISLKRLSVLVLVSNIEATSGVDNIKWQWKKRRNRILFFYSIIKWHF